MTNAGLHNLKNISEEFGCDIISMKPNINAQKIIMRKTFEEYGKPTYFVDRYIYTYPLHMALKFNTPFLVYGENVSYEYGGDNAVETYSAKEQINNGVGGGIPTEELLVDGLTLKDLNFFEPPALEDIDKLTISQHYAMDLLTVGPNLAGLPHLSIPIGLVDKMPVGLLITGNHFKELNILKLGAALE